MSYKTYEKYKNSNVEWIGDIPTHWQTNRFKIVFSYSKGKNPQTFFDEPGDGLAPYLSMEYLRNDIAPTYVPIKECPLKANNGDLLLLWDGSNAGEFVVSKEGLVSSTMAKLNPNIIIDNNFYKYVCKALELLLRELTIGMGVPHVSSLELNNILLPNIPLEEQQQIANYLDKKTAKINATIAKNEELIQLLEEKRVALINQVVTKGLNPDVPMKDSGVEWIGEIPEHWSLTKFRNVLKERSEKNNPIKSKERLSLSIDKGVTLYAEKTTNLDRFKDDFTQYKLAHEGDLVLNSMNMIVGAVGVSKYFGCVSPVYYTYYDETDDNIVTTYCDYLFKTKTIKKFLRSLGRGIMSIDRGDDRINTCRLKVSRDDLRNMYIPYPPLNEQKQINTYLDKECERIANITNIINKHIKLLEEYKTSLIHHIVTGKIDVRGEEI